jgi:hypothetical protein
VKFIVALAAAGAALSAVASAAPAVSQLPLPSGAAVILNTGSTNEPGYRIVVTAAGSATYAQGMARGSGVLSRALAARFFADLAGAMPLSKMNAPNPCMKSASFGYSLFVWWRGERSPDLSCGGTQLGTDAAAIAKALGVSLRSRHAPIAPLPNEPRKPIPSPAPAS